MTINGIPAHPLLVHFVVVLVPLVALAAVAVTVWPAAQRKLTFLVPLGALAGVVLVPLTVQAGRDLEATLKVFPALQRHANFGGQVLWWVIALAVTTVAQWYVIYRGVERPLLPRVGTRPLLLGIGALEVVAAIGTIVIVVLTGDSGAHAVWGS